MQKILRLNGAWLACILALAPLARAETPAVLPEALRGVNPDLLSGGVFAALDAAGAFGPRPGTPPRARASHPDASKGRPPAVLDARVGVNVRLGDDPDALPANQRGQAEPHIVRSLANPDVLLATFQEGRFPDAGAVDCGFAVSRDGGLTWTRALVPELTTASGGRFNRATDPVAGAGPQGDLYLQNLASVQGAFDLAAVVVSRSTDNGTTWSAPITVFQPSSTLVFPDKNWLAVNDHAAAPNAGRLVSTWSNFNRNAAGQTLSIPLVASVSDDRGLTWSAPIEITPLGTSNQGTQPVFLPDGSLVVVYTTFINPNNAAQFSIQCKRSPNGGLTFPATATTIVASVAGWDDPDLRDAIFLPSACVSRQSGELFVTYVAVVNGTPRVMVTRSSNQGATWSQPIVASDQPAGVSVMNPTIAAAADGRSVSVFFTDKRHAPDGRNFVDHYAAMSFDGGATWQPNIRLSEMSSDIRFGPATSRGVMLGDYMGIAPPVATDPAYVAIWCDTRTGDSDPFVARFAASPDANYAAWGVARKISVGPQLLADTDQDGTLDQIEYLTGTDPRRVDFGESFWIRRSSATTLDIAWPQRPEITGTVADVALSANPQLQFGAQGIALGSDPFSNAIPLPALAAGELPDVALPPGLVWRGIRDTISPGDPRAIAFAVRFTNTFGGNSVGGAVATVNTDSRLINLSTRGRSGTGASQMIVGFVLEGSKSMLVRAAGPTLGALGVTGALADPQLTFTAQASALVRTNDNWQQPGSGATAELFARVGAFPFAPNSLDAALALPLGNQNYTTVVSGANATSGITLVEAYDADPTPGAAGNPRLLNLSTRGEVGAGENALIAGFVLNGTQSRRVLIRASGPALEQVGVSGVLRDPVLSLFRGGTSIASNDDWEISRSAAAIAATAQRVGAFPLTAASLDAALLITLSPGAYTAVITGADGGTGIALIEVYDAD